MTFDLKKQYHVGHNQQGNSGLITGLILFPGLGVFENAKPVNNKSTLSDVCDVCAKSLRAAARLVKRMIGIGDGAYRHSDLGTAPAASVSR